jgi:SWI/SNF-related matrix-associated actin-dependent regulator of chromatin subfamily A member 5
LLNTVSREFDDPDGKANGVGKGRGRDRDEDDEENDDLDGAPPAKKAKNGVKV